VTTFIDLLRHGETENSHRYCGSTNHPLTQLGWTQMWNTIEKKPQQWQQIITSPLARCANFAQALGQLNSIPVKQDVRIKEIHFGDWEDQSAVQLMETDPDTLSRFWYNPLNYPPPNGEHLLDFETRVLSAWSAIQQQFSGQKILLITHSGVIRIIICHIQQHPIERLLEFEVNHAEMKHVSIELKEYSQTKILSDSQV
jgi:alpha-ribazole phosphatase